MNLVTKTIRGQYEGHLLQAGNQYFVKVLAGGKLIKEKGPFYDEDEASVELGNLIDAAWREGSRPTGKLVRRM